MRSVTRRVRSSGNDTQAGVVYSLVSAFERLLSEGRSFTEVSVDQLSKEAGIARATFYLYFRNKGELVRHLMGQVEKEVRLAATRSMADLERFGRAEFLAFMRSVVEINDRHRAAIRAMVETSAYDAEVATVYQIFMAHTMRDTRRIIAKLEGAGRAHPSVTPEVADALSWAVERSCAQMLKDGDTAERKQQIAELLTHIVWSAIAAPEA